MSFFSARNTDNPAPFRPALQYLLSGGRQQSYHSRRNSSSSIDLEDNSRRNSKMASHSSAELPIPLITLSRSTSPYARKNSISNQNSDEDDDVAEFTASRRPFLSQGRPARGFKGMMGQGGLGQWLFTTRTGWNTYVGFLVFALGGCGCGLLMVNRLILLTGVYKFPFPLTLSLIELVICHLLLLASAGLTRLTRKYLTNAGLSGLIAPSNPIQLGQTSNSRTTQGRRTGLVGLLSRVFRRGSGGIAGGGLFEFEIGVARKVFFLAVIYVLKVLLSNISFAYAQLPMYMLSRIAVIPLSLFFSTFINGASHSVPILSATLSATLNLFIATAQGHLRVTWESIIAGVASSLFVALYPVQLQGTYNSLVASLTPPQHDLMIGAVPSYSSAPSDGYCTKEETQAAWRLLHYTSLMSILILTPIVIMSGELGSMLRNIYFLDVFFHNFMLVCGGLGTWSVFLTTVLLTRATSPLTTTFLLVPRAGVMLPSISGFKMPVHTWIGIIMCWASSAWYLYIRKREGQSKRL